MKKLVVLGSTGSIGQSTLDVAGRFPDRVEVAGLAAGSNVELLAEQVKKFKTRYVVLKDEKAAEEFRRLGFSGVEAWQGVEGLCRLASLAEADMVVNGLVGSLGLRPSLAALQAGKRLCLANKEALVMGGELVLRAAKEGGGELLPVDSEHSALFQCMLGGKREEVRRIILTASGGPFLNWPKEKIASATPQQALKHPTWKMGKKITIDSATLFNKALEIIEAHYLFGLAPEQIEVMIHPQSVVHSLVEFRDGSTLAQLGPPDMRIPLQYAIFYPERPDASAIGLDLGGMEMLTFQPVDHQKFLSIKMAYRALEIGGTAPAVLAAADECAVSLFLDGKIGFNEIFELVGETLEAHKPRFSFSIDEVEMAEEWARQYLLGKLNVTV